MTVIKFINEDKEAIVAQGANLREKPFRTRSIFTPLKAN